MNEILYIRISSQENAEIQWIITNAQHEDEIASGTLANRHELSQLTSKAEGRQVKVLLNGADVRLKSLNIPGKADRAIRGAAPFMLEDDLAHDVEQLFFAFANKPSHHTSNENCFIAFALHQQIQLWLAWFADAKITVKDMLPDVLAMPTASKDWTALHIGNEWLIRCAPWQGMVVDDSSLSMILGVMIDPEQPQTINAYSPFLEEVQGINLQEQPAELPMLLLAQGYEQSRFNLLQGQYVIKEQRSPNIRRWLQVAAVASFALLVNLGGKAIELIQLSQQYDQVTAQIEADYKKAFPKTKRVRINTVKRQLSSKISELGGNANDSSLLNLVDNLRPAFVKVPTLKPDSLRYDAKRNELRITVTGKDYQSFEQFKTELEKSSLKVEMGAQNNQGDQVVGSFNIKGRS